MSESSVVRPIDSETVNRICSGQVVLNLATAVKELVENSIDAGANNIQVKLEEYGYNFVEVIDNGHGVEESNFQALALKHYTSKISNFADVFNVGTFGFRGEALSSLCALCEVTVTTQHKNTSVGATLKFNHNGEIISNVKTARNTGTTVRLEKLFITLPVRRVHFQKNLKSEFSKMCNILYAYGLQCKGIRLMCTNQIVSPKDSSKAKAILIMETKGESVESNISSIFGVKQKAKLLKITEIKPSYDTLKSFCLEKKKLDLDKFKLEGYISSCEHKCGRSASDRQFYYINSRPIDNPKVSKLVNSIYHQYNKHQYPFVVLNIKVEAGSFDLNVTPDKRLIYVQSENLLLAIIKESLLGLFGTLPSTMIINNVGILYSSSDSDKPVSELLEDFKGKSQSCIPKHEVKPVYQSSAQLSESCLEKLNQFRRMPKDTNDTDSDTQKSGTPSGSQKRVKTASTLNNYFKSLEPAKKMKTLSIESLKASFSRSIKPKSSTSAAAEEENEIVIHVPKVGNFPSTSTSHKMDCDMTTFKDIQEIDNVEIFSSSQVLFSKELSRNEEIQNPADIQSSELDDESRKKKIAKIAQELKETPNISDEERKMMFISRLKDINLPEISNHKKDMQINDDSDDSNENESKRLRLDSGLTDIDRKKRRTVTINANIESILGEYLKFKTAEKAKKDWKSEEVKFLADYKLNNTDAIESELQREISKDKFKEMEMIGQFNLSFIITKLGQDIFIIDQHASDEKYNFEMLKSTTVIQSQKLIFPQKLDLSVEKEELMVQHSEVFKKNGFEFVFNEEGTPTQRISLTSIPMSWSTIFGKDDIEELLFYLESAPELDSIRPSRVDKMFASRACRKSVMVGTALDHREMRKIVNHMGEIEHPWNCPHGRPTMRHLVNLNLMLRSST